MEITPTQFAQIEDCLPKQRGNVSLSNLQVLNAILYVAEHGCKWRGLAKARGFNDMNEAERERLDAEAKAKGFKSRKEAKQARNDAWAMAQGFKDRNVARLSRRDDLANEKGFKDRIEAERAARDDRAARQLGEGADGSDLNRLQRIERNLAATVGIDVADIRRFRPTVVPASSSTLAVQSLDPTPLALASLADATTIRWNIGDRFTIPSEDGQRRLFQVIRIPSDDQSIDIGVEEILDAGANRS
jgi:transposase